MILTSMYTANLTAHLTLERSANQISELSDLLRQNEYSWGLITDRNLESMMERDGDKKYEYLVNRGVKLNSLDEGIRKVNAGKFVLIDDSSVITYNFKNDCLAQQTFTGTFQNQWAFGMQMNSPYASVINNMMLKYRETGWIVTKFDKWYKGGKEISCSVTVGSDTIFGLSILSGLFLILAIGALISSIVISAEFIFAAYRDSVAQKQSFHACLKKRLYLKDVAKS